MAKSSFFSPANSIRQEIQNNSFDRIEFKDVLIIGNGPSAITLSFLLAGHWPYYSPDDNDPHPIHHLHDRLLYHCADSHQVDDQVDGQHQSSKIKLRSLMESDLMILSQGLTGRTTANPVAILMDQLQHPNVDFGDRIPSTLKWTFCKDRSVDHVVIGSASSPGGIWHAIAKTCSSKSHPCNDILTLSRRSLMQLPVLKIRDDQEGGEQKDEDNPLPDTRIPYRLVAEYYCKYVDHFGLNRYFRNKTQAIRLDWDPLQKCFLVDTISKFNKNKKCRIRYMAKRVVLAEGTSTSPKMLNIPGETYRFVLHSITKLDVVIKQTQLLPCWKMLSKTANSIVTYPILIVGSGLSAADALISLSQRCQRRPLRIIHLFRKSIKDRSLIFNQLAMNDATYPEYHQVFQLMRHSIKNVQCLACHPNPQFISSSMNKQSMLRFEHYQAYQKCILSSISRSNGGSNGMRTATLEFLENKSSPTLCSRCYKPLRHQTTIRISFALILIGSNPQLDYVTEDISRKLARNPGSSIDLRHNPIDIHPYSYECNRVPGLYALGPLVGDNFVRYLQGGALAVANHIWNSHSIILKQRRYHIDDQEQ